MLDVVGQARPAALDELLIGLLEAGRRLHTGFAPGATFQIAYTVQRGDDLLTELGAFVEDGVDHVRGGVFTTRKALIMRLVAEQLVTYETDIAQGGLVIGHSVNLSGGFFGSGDRLSGQLLIGFVTLAVAPQVKQAFETYVSA